MELLWLIIIVIGVVSKVSENKKKQEQRQRELQQRRATMTGTGQGQAQPRPVRQVQTAPPPPPAAATRTPSPRGEEALESLPEGLQSLIRMFTGEDEVKKDRQRVQLELERRRREEAREKEMLESAQRMEEQEDRMKSEWADEWVDPDEIQDLPDFITDEQMALDEQEQTTSAIWNLTQARKGVIWNEILERPRFRTQGKHTRLP